jgi:signal transduction histidine kinase
MLFGLHGGFVSQDNLGLFDTPPNRQQVRFSIAIVAVLFAGLPVAIVARNVWLGQIDAFIPMTDATTSLVDMIIATLLYVQAGVFRSRALTVLASGYVFTALILIPHVLTFPGAFAPTGLLSAGISTTAWLYIFWRAAFPVTAILYVLFDRPVSSAQPGIERQSGKIVAGVFAATALAAAAAMVATRGDDLLPMLYRTRSDVNFPMMVKVTSVLIGLLIVAVAMLLRRRKSVLDMWLLVVASAWLAQTLLLLLVGGRFTLGWYTADLLVVGSHLLLMLALIAESSRLYARLALTTAARNRERESRLMSMDAVAAAISHELGQPLTAVMINARASLNRLTRDEPDPETAIKLMLETIEAGQRAFDVIKSVRAMFAKKLGSATDFNINDLVRETATLLDRELASERVSLRLALDEGLPPVTADRVQLQQVLINLLTNAVQSLAVTRGRPRQIEVRSTLNDQDLLLDFSDTGVGIAQGEMERIFDPFFTTKASGTGLGLSLCRTIVEEHRGRLWASRGAEHGATFHLQLPYRRHARTTTQSNPAIRLPGSGTPAFADRRANIAGRLFTP